MKGTHSDDSRLRSRAPGKAIYDLGPIVGPLEGVSGDILCCINNSEGPSVLLCGGIHGDEYEAQVVLRQPGHPHRARRP